MQKRFFSWFPALCLLTLIGSPAQAEQGSFYFGVQGGGTYVQDINEDLPNKLLVEPGLAVGAVAGYTMKNLEGADVRLEAELAYRYNEADEFQQSDVDGDISSSALMFNAAVDFVNKTAFTPYVMAGLGAANVSFNDLESGGITFLDDDDTVLAYQYGVGCGFNLTEKLALDLGYRYFSTAKPEVKFESGVKGKLNYKNHALMLGLRFSF